MPKILITSPDLHGTTTVGINGDIARVPHNKTVQVSDAQFEVLEQSDLGVAKIKKMDDGDPAEVTIAADDAHEDPADASNATDDNHGDAKAGTESAQGPGTPAGTSDGGNALLGEGGQQSGQDSGKQSDDDTFLDRSVGDIAEDLDEVDAARVDALIAAERAGKNRSTLIEKLEHKKTQLAQ